MPTCGRHYIGSWLVDCVKDIAYFDPVAVPLVFRFAVDAFYLEICIARHASL
jgi:hypothetical protein